MKKKIISLALIVCLLAIAIVGGTMAYFTDTHEQTNTFTAGNVDIILFEHLVEKDEDPESERFGDLVAAEKITSKDQTYHLYPAMTVDKDPTIRVKADSEDAYVAAKVTVIGDVYDLMKLDDIEGYIDINTLASGGLMEATTTANPAWNDLFVFENETCAVYQEANVESNTWTLYIFMKDVQAARDEIVLFDTLQIPETYDNAEMAKINGMQIHVQAFATQTNGFADCFTAITTAFSNDFDFGRNPQ